MFGRIPAPAPEKKKSVKNMLLLFLLGIVIVVAGYIFLRSVGNPVDRHTVASLDSNSLLGTWYELARFDHRFERGLQKVSARYTLQDDGTLRIENSGYDPSLGARRTAVGKAKFTSDPGRLRVSFFWKFYSDYNILERGAQGEWMLVGSRSPRYLWILSRTPSLPAAELAYIFERARERGYDTSCLILRDQE